MRYHPTKARQSKHFCTMIESLSVQHSRRLLVWRNRHFQGIYRMRGKVVFVNRFKAASDERYCKELLSQ